MEELVSQAEKLAASGVKELVLVAQETTLYGVDLYGKKSLDRLLDKLNQITGIFWIRILYCYPEEIDDALIDAILRNEKVCHYLDMPIQHASDYILKRMGRKTSCSDLVRIINKLREKIPDICIRTTLICGFPGETEAMHEELMQFVNDMEFDRLGAFVYSPEEGTLAETYPEQVEEETKLCRREDVMELQQEISFDKNEMWMGKELWAFIEGKVAYENAYVGRTYRDAPGVDGYVFINTDEELMTGDFVKVKITGAFDRRDSKMNLPNKLTIFRVILIPFFVVFLLYPGFEGYGKYIAVAIFIVASLTDLLDGKIARKYNMVTNFGKFMDPLADKLLVCSAMICLIETGKLASWIVIVIISREFIISGFRLVASDNGIVIAANYWGKFKTTFQMLMIIVLALDLDVMYFDLLGTALTYIALILTVVSLLDYIAKNKDVLKEQK